jgi:phage repressor protein C with HTH and peptisase S24 domain
MLYDNASMLYSAVAIVRPMQQQLTLGQRIKWAISEADMTPADLARARKVSRQAVKQWLSDETVPTGPNLVGIAIDTDVDPQWLATGRGSPMGTTKGSHVKRGSDKSESSVVEVSHLHDQAADLVLIRELDVRARSGTSGGLIDVEDTDEATATVAAHGFPSAGFRQLYGAEPDRVRILEVVGDSMEPTLFPGQKVMVDTQDRAPTPPGIFVVFDGFGLVLKRVQYVAHSDPPRVKISSDNKEYDPYERTLEEAHIQGRVIGGWRRM